MIDSRQRLRARRHHEQRAAAAVLPHRCRQLDQHRGHARRRLCDRSRRPATTPRSGQSGIDPADALIDDLDLIAFEHRDVDELAERLVAMLDDDQSRRDHFDDQAERRDLARRAPHEKVFAAPPHAEMNAGPLDRGRDLRQHRGRERQLRCEQQRMARLVGGQERERDLRRLSFFAAQARPERRVDDRRQSPAAAARRNDRSYRAARAAPICRAKCSCTASATSLAAG